MTPTEFSKAPGTYFTRNRKAGFKSVILLSIGALKGTTFEHSRRFFMAAGCSPDMAPTQSALTQQLQKFSSDAFPTVISKTPPETSPNSMPFSMTSRVSSPAAVLLPPALLILSTSEPSTVLESVFSYSLMSLNVSVITRFAVSLQASSESSSTIPSSSEYMVISQMVSK